MPSKLEQLQLQFRQRLKEERMIKIHTDNQQKALSKVSKYNGVLTTTTHSSISAPKPPQPAIQPPQSHHSPIKKGSPGVDRSRPLPPISKDSSRNSSSSRGSPTSPPNEPAIKQTARSLDLEPRQASPKPAVVPQASRAPPRNGLAHRQAHSELRQPVQSHHEASVPEKRPDQELLNKLKQAELQRLKANSRVREDVPSRNGISTNTARASNELRKAVKPSAPAPAPSRPRPKPQATAAPRRAAAPASTKPRAPAASSAPSRGGSSPPRKPPGPGQSQCNVCGRNFNQDRIEKHVSICKKAASKKVKVFDATKMRVKGTEAEQFVKKGLPKTEPKPAKKSDWRKKRNEFIEAIRQAKLVQQHLAKGGKVSDLPPPIPSDTSDYVPCPHCGRKFNEGVAERHIPKCKNILSNKKNPVPARRK